MWELLTFALCFVGFTAAAVLSFVELHKIAARSMRDGPLPSLREADREPYNTSR